MHATALKLAAQTTSGLVDQDIASARRTLALESTGIAAMIRELDSELG